ncbi:MAG: indolepyruvate oxidoreductase subunit beta family protein [Pigmentiphaga sp.]|uniref:indolepyruvate oxidoreductase subunit beta family protein n=1 Tax=Pigmentiphaga sp. TaxID=1977564 RepID=UPI0029ACBFB6|nr:indolepyruvate oxidoreductase subunit beta family protein [Pigmentiphaga sp.]MDX3906803.1 indolepyruvate oxidoreductase subunit beta family protein [Pigmentiphaga sp.]
MSAPARPPEGRASSPGEDVAQRQEGGPVSAPARPRAITIAILAMGGEGGGVLADWLVDMAENKGYLAQTTSVPGVAQRTGATVYYVEMFPESGVPPGSAPVLALSPVPGEVDVVIASELMEAGRALQRGLVSEDRTTLVASTHRVYSMTERTAMGDERVDSAALLEGGRAASRCFVAADFNRIAEEAGSPISPVLYGALAATGALPFPRESFEEAIRRGGIGVQASLRAFAAGYDAAAAAVPVAPAAEPVLQEHTVRRATAPIPSAGPVPASAAPAAAPAAPGGGNGLPADVGPRLAALRERLVREFPEACHAILRAGLIRTADYQDIAYAGEYLDRLGPLRDALPDRSPASLEVLAETARHLALWMTYEDVARVADLKTRAARFDRVAAEVRLAPAQQLEINEFMHPRLEELADAMPAWLGRWMMSSSVARACVGPFTRKGRVVRTSSLSGYLLLYAVGALRGIRRSSLRYAVERERMQAWLAQIASLVPARPELALEVARAQRLIKGYGDTHVRGWGNFERIMSVLPRLKESPDGHLTLQSLVKAALSDDTGRTLEQKLATI